MVPHKINLSSFSPWTLPFPRNKTPFGYVWKCCVPHCTQWFCWSLSLWKMAISLGITPHCTHYPTSVPYPMDNYTQHFQTKPMDVARLKHSCDTLLIGSPRAGIELSSEPIGPSFQSTCNRFPWRNGPTSIGNIHLNTFEPLKIPLVFF